MARIASLIVVSSMALVIATGCKKEEQVPKPVAAPAANAPAAPAPAAAPAAPAASAQDAVNSAQAQGQAAVNNAATQGQAAAGDIATMASQKLDEAATAIKDNKVDVADKIVSELESRKASLPAAIQQRLESVRKMVDTAKAAKANGLTIPKL